MNAFETKEFCEAFLATGNLPSTGLPIEEIKQRLTSITNEEVEELLLQCNKEISEYIDEKISSSSDDKLHLNPIEYAVIIDKLDYLISDREGLSRANKYSLYNIFKDYCGKMGISKKDASMLHTFICNIKKKGEQLKEGYNIAIDRDEGTITTCLCRILSNYSNNSDKIVYPNISRAILDKIEKRHPMSLISSVIFYREASSDETFIVTTSGISYNHYTKQTEIEWKKLDRVVFDSRDSMYYLYTTDKEFYVDRISQYNLIKWQSNNNVIDTALSAVAAAFIDDSSERFDKFLVLFDNEQYQEAIGIIDDLIFESPRESLYHLYLGIILEKMMYAGEKVNINDIEDEFQAAKELEPGNLLYGILYTHWGNFHEFLGNNRLAREKYIMAMDSPNADERKDAKELYNKLMQENSISWSQYTDKVQYKDRKLIMPVKDIVGCATEDITAFQIREIPECIHFPVGHPVSNELYIGHPFNPSIYVPFKSHDDIFFIDKINEMCYVFQCLGAEEISITSIKGKSIEELSNGASTINVSGDIKSVSGTSNIESNFASTTKSSSGQEITITQTFDPKEKPFIPDNLIWYPQEIQWQRISQQRMNGNMLEYHQVLSSKDTSFISSNERKSIESSARYLWAKANGNKEIADLSSIDESNETQWRVDVKFRNTNQLVDKCDNTFSSIILENEGSLLKQEQKYKEEVLFFLEDGIIGDFERKALDRKRIKFGISEERAREIEEMCKTTLTEEEKVFIDMLKSILTEGGITQRSRRILDHEAEDLGISKERQEELERSI